MINLKDNVANCVVYFYEIYTNTHSRKYFTMTCWCFILLFMAKDKHALNMFLPKQLPKLSTIMLIDNHIITSHIILENICCWQLKYKQKVLNIYFVLKYWDQHPLTIYVYNLKLLRSVKSWPMWVKITSIILLRRLRLWTAILLFITSLIMTSLSLKLN